MRTRTKRLLLIAGTVCLCAAASWITGLGEDAQYPEERVHRPTPVPDRVVLTFLGDTTTTRAVTWRTDTSVKKAIAQIALAEDGPGFTKAAQAVHAVTTTFKSDLGEAHYHSARFTGLKADTVYLYRVGDGANWSEWHQFRTASEKPAPVSFVYVGDAQNDILSMWSRVIRTGYSQASHAHFLVHAGDLVNRSNRDAEWGEWFRAAGWIYGAVPSLPAPGNHEYNAEGKGRAITRHWRTQFTLPENGPEALAETAYYVDLQGVRMVALNSNERQEEQARWLDEVLSKNPNRWTILTFHHPIFSTAKGRDNKEIRELWQPVIDKHAVDLVLQGHDHSYARSNLVFGKNARAGKGTVYVVSVSGPKMYQLERKDWMERAASNTQLFQVVTVDGDRLEYESRTARGALYDAFELHKRSGQANELINKAPSTPERLRDGGSSGGE